jgi:hypothetical protein
MSEHLTSTRFGSSERSERRTRADDFVSSPSFAHACDRVTGSLAASRSHMSADTPTPPRTAPSWEHSQRLPLSLFRNVGSQKGAVR